MDKDIKDIYNNNINGVGSIKDINNIYTKVSDGSAEETVKKDGRRATEIGMANLVSFADMTVEKQREIARMGGIASQEKKKARKTAQEIIHQLAEMQLSGKQIEESLGDYKSIVEENATAYTVMCAKAFLSANQGDIKAASFIRDTAGDKPDENIKIESNTMTSGDLELLRNISVKFGIQNNITDSDIEKLQEE